MRKRHHTMNFGSLGLARINPEKKDRASQERTKLDVRTGDTLKMEALTPEQARKAIEDRPTEFADSQEIFNFLDSLPDSDPPKQNDSMELTNEKVLALLGKNNPIEEEEDYEEPVPSRPAGEFPAYISEPPEEEAVGEPVPSAPTAEVEPQSQAAPIQSRRRFINKRTRSIILAMALGASVGGALIQPCNNYLKEAKIYPYND